MIISFIPGYWKLVQLSPLPFVKTSKIITYESVNS